MIGEYILHMSKLAANIPSYYIFEEFTSAVISRRQRLNVDVSVAQDTSGIINDPPTANKGREP